MARVLLWTLLFATVVAIVLCIPTKSNKKTDKKWWEYDWNDDYNDYYDWYNYDDYNDWYYYDWDSYWYDYDYGCDLSDDNVRECISGYCVDITSICSGMDGCSSMENDWFCSAYKRGIQKAKESVKKRNLGEKIDDKKLQTRVYQVITRKMKEAKAKKTDQVDKKVKKHPQQKLDNIKRLLARKALGLKQRMRHASDKKTKA